MPERRASVKLDTSSHRKLGPKIMPAGGGRTKACQAAQGKSPSRIPEILGLCLPCDSLVPPPSFPYPSANSCPETQYSLPSPPASRPPSHRTQTPSNSQNRLTAISISPAVCRHVGLKFYRSSLARPVSLAHCPPPSLSSRPQCPYQHPPPPIPAFRQFFCCRDEISTTTTISTNTALFQSFSRCPHPLYRDWILPRAPYLSPGLSFFVSSPFHSALRPLFPPSPSLPRLSSRLLLPIVLSIYRFYSSLSYLTSTLLLPSFTLPPRLLHLSPIFSSLPFACPPSPPALPAPWRSCAISGLLSHSCSATNHVTNGTLSDTYTQEASCVE